MGKKHRIMHGLSEVAGQNSYSVQGLKQIGEKAESVIYTRHPFGYPYDRCLNIDRSKRILLPYYALKLLAFYIEALFRYDTFHFHFGHSILNCVELWSYRLLRKKVYFEFHGSDLRDYKKACRIMGMPYDEKEATDPRIHRRNRKICESADGIIVHDDELIPYLPDKCAPIFVVPLRIDINRFEPRYPETKVGKIRIVHAPSKRSGKGTEYVLKAFEGLKSRYENIELILVEGKTQQEAFNIYKTADIIVDQLFAGTYGVFAIEAMAMGKPVITYISEDMKMRLPNDLPVISGNIHSISKAIESLIIDADLRRETGVAGRKYVENYHDHRYIAYVLRDIYYGKSKPLCGREAFEQIRNIRHKKEKNY